MHRLTSPEWRPIGYGLVGTLIILALALGAEARATERLFQTIPTPTPGTIPSPTGDAASTQGGEGSAAGAILAVRQEITPADVLPGQQVSIRLRLTNASTDDVTGIILTNPLDPALKPLEVRATQGAARVQGQSVLIDLGTVDVGQTAVVMIRARVAPDAQAGQIILNQATAYFDGGQTSSDAAAAGLPPSELPATGQDRRGP